MLLTQQITPPSLSICVIQLECCLVSEDIVWPMAGVPNTITPKDGGTKDDALKWVYGIVPACENEILQQDDAWWWYALTGDVQCDEYLPETWEKPSYTHHPQQASVFLGCWKPLVMAKMPLIRGSHLLRLLQDLTHGTLYDTRKPNNINLSAPSRESIKMRCNISPEIWQGIVWSSHYPIQRVVPTDGIRVNQTSFAPSPDLPPSLLMNLSAHSKLHEMYLQGNSCRNPF